MKKKILIVMISVLCCLNVIGCEKKPPKGMSDEMYEVGCETVEVLDSYIDGTMTYSFIFSPFLSPSIISGIPTL